MKKLLMIGAALAITSFTSFAQGNIEFGGVPHGIYNLSTGTYQGAQGYDVGLLFFTTTPNISTISATGSSIDGSVSYTTASAWAALLASAILVDGTTAGTPVVANIVGTAGTFSYNSASAWSCDNVNSGVTYNAVEVAWNTGGGLYTTLAAAAAANEYVGWSKVFTYTPTSGAVQPTAYTASLVGTYGVGGTVPEPCTMALLGLGGLSLLAIRRRK